jgi:hypothetical protein
MLFNDCGGFGAAGPDRWNLSRSPRVTIILPQLPFGNGLTVPTSELIRRIIVYYLLFATHAISRVWNREETRTLWIFMTLVWALDLTFV